jgi:hypothetical protein
MSDQDKLNRRLELLLNLVRTNSFTEIELATKLSVTDTSLKGVKDAKLVIFSAFMSELIEVDESGKIKISN